MNLLVLDIGSTSTKGSVYNENFTLLASHRVQTAPHVVDDIVVEQDPYVWKNALLAIMAVIREKNIKYNAITVTSQRSSVFLVDNCGQPLCNAIMWQDRRTQSICARYAQDAAVVYQKTGLPIKPIFGAPKIVWLKENMRELYPRSYKIVTIADYVIHLLTGAFVSDFTYGNRSLLMNLRTMQWDEELLQLFGVEREKLCRLVPPGSKCGTLTRFFAQHAGLSETVEVFTAGGDQQVAALGLGVFAQGRAEVTHGTGSFCIFHSDAVVQDEKKQIVCNVAAVPGAYILESSALATGAVYDWLLKQCYGCTDYAEIDREITLTPPLSNGVIALPCFQGTGAPDWNTEARGVFYNLSLCTKRGDIARAVLEGIAVYIAANLDLLEQAAGRACVLSLSGGLTSLPAFNQLQADIYNRCTVVYSNREATSAGAWMSWMKQTGRCSDYAKAFETVRNASVITQYIPRPEIVKQYAVLKQKLGDLQQKLWGAQG